MKLKLILLLLLVVLSTTVVLAEDEDTELQDCIDDIMERYKGMNLETAQQQCLDLGKYTKAQTRKTEAQQNTETDRELRKQQRTVEQNAYEQARRAYTEAKERYVSYNRETRNTASIFSQAVQEQNECEDATGDECENENIIPAAKNYLVASINTMIANIDTVVADIQASEYLTEDEASELVRSLQFHRDSLESFIEDANEAETKLEVVQVKVQVLRTWPKVKVLIVKYRNMLRQSDNDDEEDDDQGEDEDEEDENEYECEDIVSCSVDADCGPVDEVTCNKNGTATIRRTPGQCIESNQCGNMCQFGRPVFIETVCENGCDENGCIETEDVVPPAVGISIETVTSGIGVNIVCQDDQSGCTDSFEYGIGDACLGNQTNMTTMSYTDNPIIIEDSTTICVIAYDNAGNSEESTQVIDVNNQCFNGQQDPNEEGVDCGGICDNQCNTCANGVQDWNEQGVDCGGACGLHCLTEQVDCNVFSFACSTDADCGGLQQTIECTDQGSALITYTSSYCASNHCGNVCQQGRGEIVEEFCEYGCSEDVGCLEADSANSAAYCIDSDGQNYETQGTVTFVEYDAAGVGTNVTVTDYCEDNTTVSEHYCVGVDQARETHECEGYCLEGACIN